MIRHIRVILKLKASHFCFRKPAMEQLISRYREATILAWSCQAGCLALFLSECLVGDGSQMRKPCLITVAILVLGVGSLLFSSEGVRQLWLEKRHTGSIDWAKFCVPNAENPQGSVVGMTLFLLVMGCVISIGTLSLMFGGS